MTTIVRRKRLGKKSIEGIIAASQEPITYANNFEGLPEDEVYVRWGCTSTLPNPEARVINSAKGIHRVSDKSGFRVLMQEHGLCPKTWWNYEDIPAYMQEVYPLVVRTQTHAQGRGLWAVRGPEELRKAIHAAGPGFYVNQFIDKVAEFRVFVMQGRVAWVARKTPGNPEDVAWNVAKGGRFDNVRWGNWNMRVINNALKVWELSKLHFGGVDVMLTDQGDAYCVEMNSAPSQTSPYRQQCVAKTFDYMTRNESYDRRLFPAIEAERWHEAIHPAVVGDNG